MIYVNNNNSAFPFIFLLSTGKNCENLQGRYSCEVLAKINIVLEKLAKNQQCLRRTLTSEEYTSVKNMELIRVDLPNPDSPTTMSVNSNPFLTAFL